MERPGHTRRFATVAYFRTWRGSRPRVVPTTSCCCGEGGIRTHDTLSDIHAFQACAFSRSATSPASGERRIRTYGTVAGTPDFESGAFDHSASSPAIQLSVLRLPETLKEPGHPLAAFGLESPRSDLEPVVDRKRVQVGQSAQCARLRARSAVHDAVAAGREAGAAADGARPRR